MAFKSPMGAEMAGKPYRDLHCRKDWADVGVGAHR